MTTQLPDLAISSGTLPGSREDMTANQAQAVPAPRRATGAGLLLSATERTRHRRLRHLGRTDRQSLNAVLRAGLTAHLGVITGGWLW